MKVYGSTPAMPLLYGCGAARKVGLGMSKAGMPMQRRREQSIQMSVANASI